MNVWGHRYLCNTVVTIIKHFFAILGFISLLFSASYLSSITTTQLNELALSQLGPETPGLLSLLYKINKDPGYAFEVESALLLSAQGERVIGLGLDITFYHNTARVQLDEAIIDLPTTEFDIISEHFAVECKCSKNPSKNCDIQQFVKEKNMIAWCKKLVTEIEMGEVMFSFMLSRKNKTPFLIIKSPSTNSIDVPLTSTWFTSKDPELCREQFITMVQLLAAKESRVFFKAELPSTFSAQLALHNIAFDDHVHLAMHSSQNFFNNPLLPDINSLTTQIDSITLNGTYEA